jgi:hypothetical protein
MKNLCLLAIIVFTGNVSKATDNDTTFSETWNINSLESIGRHNVTVYGNPKVIDTDTGTAMQFDGNGDMLLVDANSVGSAKSFTIEVLFKPEAGINITNQPRFIHIEDPSDTEAKRITIELRVNNKNEWYFDAFLKTDIGNLTLIDSTKTHPTNEWMHVAVTYAGKTFSTFVNGVKELSGEVNYSQNILSNGGKTSIGARQNFKNWYSGCIKIIKFTHRALQPDNFIINEKNDSLSLTLKNAFDNKNIEVYPVPANQKLYIKIPQGMERTDILPSIYNVFGKQEYTTKLLSENSDKFLVLDLKNYTEGLYILKLQYQNAFLTRKVLIRH